MGRRANVLFRAFLVVVITLSAGEFAAQLRAADGPRPKAATDPAQADADFHVQGEFDGWLRDAGGRERFVGLQVVALGAGRFDAWLFEGGLPGNGWDRQHRERLQGLTVDGVTRCESAEHKIEVRDVRARVVDAAGHDEGTLKKVVRRSRRLGAAPPSNAIVLFDGTPSPEITGAKVTPEGLLEIGGLTKRAVGDFRLHVEFLVPYMPEARGQARGNSGVYIQQRYEVQILDSFGLVSGDNDCGSLYRQQAPELNMCFPPLTWQTYDIEFRSPKFDAEGNKTANARLTVYHNGIAIHDDRDVKAKTGAGQKEGPEPRPILFQNHGDPVRFQNLWLVELSDETVEPACGRPGLLRRLFGRCGCRRGR